MPLAVWFRHRRLSVLAEVCLNLIFTESGRPTYSPAAAAAAKAKEEEDRKLAEEAARVLSEEDEKRKSRTKIVSDLDERAPRSEDGELILKRREVHSGRALTVSTGNYSICRALVASSTCPLLNRLFLLVLSQWSGPSRKNRLLRPQPWSVSCGTRKPKWIGFVNVSRLPI